MAIRAPDGANKDYMIAEDAASKRRERPSGHESCINALSSKEDGSKS